MICSVRGLSASSAAGGLRDLRWGAGEGRRGGHSVALSRRAGGEGPGGKGGDNWGRAGKREDRRHGEGPSFERSAGRGRARASFMRARSRAIPGVAPTPTATDMANSGRPAFARDFDVTGSMQLLLLLDPALPVSRAPCRTGRDGHSHRAVRGVWPRLFPRGGAGPAFRRGRDAVRARTLAVLGRALGLLPPLPRSRAGASGVGGPGEREGGMQVMRMEGRVRTCTAGAHMQTESTFSDGQF